MGMTNNTETDVLKSLLSGVDLPYRTGANLYVALFSQDPGETGSTTFEVDYLSYARVVVSKANGWTDSGTGTFSITNALQFPKSTGGGVTATHVGVMTAATGGQMLISGALNSPLVITTGIQPQFAGGSLTVSLD